MKKFLLLILLFIAGSGQWLHTGTLTDNKPADQKKEQQQAYGLTQEALDAMAIDPQSWTFQEFMTWNDWTPNPVVNYEDPNDNVIPAKRTISGMIILVDFPDQPMISGQPAGSELIGNPVVSELDKSKLGQFWCDFLNTPSADNNYVTLNGYFLENS